MSSVQLLDKTRKIGKLLHNNNSSKVVFNDICAVMQEILDSNVLVISKKGKVLIERYYDARDRKTIPDSLGYHEVRYTYFRGSYTQQAAYYDTEGNLMRCNKGYAVMDYTLTQEGKVTQVVYLDRDGRTPVNSDKGYARIIYGLNQDGISMPMEIPMWRRRMRTRSGMNGTGPIKLLKATGRMGCL